MAEKAQHTSINAAAYSKDMIGAVDAFRSFQVSQSAGVPCNWQPAPVAPGLTVLAVYIRRVPSAPLLHVQQLNGETLTH